MNRTLGNQYDFLAKHYCRLITLRPVYDKITSLSQKYQKKIDDL